jgi:hypothetical protein
LSCILCFVLLLGSVWPAHISVRATRSRWSALNSVISMWVPTRTWTNTLSFSFWH